MFINKYLIDIRSEQILNKITFSYPQHTLTTSLLCNQARRTWPWPPSSIASHPLPPPLTSPTPTTPPTFVQWLPHQPPSSAASVLAPCPPAAGADRGDSGFLEVLFVANWVLLRRPGRPWCRPTMYSLLGPLKVESFLKVFVGFCLWDKFVVLRICRHWICFGERVSQRW